MPGLPEFDPRKMSVFFPHRGGKMSSSTPLDMDTFIEIRAAEWTDTPGSAATSCTPALTPRPDNRITQHTVELLWPDKANPPCQTEVRQICQEATAALATAIYNSLPILIEYGANPDASSAGYDPIVCNHLAICGGPLAPVPPFDNDRSESDGGWPKAMILVAKDEWNAVNKRRHDDEHEALDQVNDHVRFVLVEREAAAMVVAAMAQPGCKVRLGYGDAGSRNTTRRYSSVVIGSDLRRGTSIG
jgi:hypothetical protein